jgi:hypothetical protein
MRGRFDQRLIKLEGRERPSPLAFVAMATEADRQAARAEARAWELATFGSLEDDYGTHADDCGDTGAAGTPARPGA